jgi:hypothetical protein
MRSFECDGLWWIPADPSDTVSGRLRFSDDSGVTLALAGVLGEPSHSLDEKPVPIIVGLAWDCPQGREFTLEDCRLTRSSLSIPGLHRETYSARRLYAGARLENKGDLLFSSVSVELSGLASWAQGLTGLSRKATPPGGEGGNRFEVAWSPPKPYTGQVPGGSLVLGVRATSSGGGRIGTIEERVRFKIEFDRALPAEEIDRRYVFPLRDWVSFATDQPSAIEDVVVPRSSLRPAIRIFTAQGADVQTLGETPRHRMLFTLSGVAERAIDLIARWIVISDERRDAYAPYFSIQYKRDTFVEVAFLAAFQALEVNQRRRFADRSAAPSLAELVRASLEEHWDIVGPLFGGQLQLAVGDILLAHKFVVHRDAGLDDDPDFGVRLYWLTQKMMLLVRADLLAQLGLMAAERSQFLTRSRLYTHIRNSAERDQAPTQ